MTYEVSVIILLLTIAFELVIGIVMLDKIGQAGKINTKQLREQAEANFKKLYHHITGMETTTRDEFKRQLQKVSQLNTQYILTAQNELEKLIKEEAKQTRSDIQQVKTAQRASKKRQHKLLGKDTADEQTTTQS